MIRVAALTSGRNTPGSRFRVRQFIDPLAAHGVVVSEHWPIVSKFMPAPGWARPSVDVMKSVMRLPGIVSARRSDVAWLQREFVPAKHTWERFAGPRQLFDVDDAIWLTGRDSFSEEIAANSFGVIAGNDFIADHYRPVARRVWVVPTSVDTEVWKPVPVRPTGPWIIGWMGTSSNLGYLVELDEMLGQFLGRHENALLLVVCDRSPKFRHVPRRQLRFVRWSPSIEVSMMQQMSVGLMPLPPTEWALGKCAFKMLLYMAGGIPVIASPVGVCDLLLRADRVGVAARTPDEWYGALSRLNEDREFAASAGRAGRKLVDADYSVKRNAARLAAIFQEAVS